MAKIWVSSDLHLGHANMYSFLGMDGVTRVRKEFQDHKEGDHAMIERHNALVKPEDHWYCLGDVAIPSWALGLVPKMNGIKRIVLGNHDVHKIKLYSDAGFKKIRGLHQYGGLWLSHAPMHWGEEHSIERKAKIIGNVHGHIHERPSPTPWHYNVCVEQTGYAPVLLDEIIEIMRKRAGNGYAAS